MDTSVTKIIEIIEIMEKIITIIQFAHPIARITLLNPIFFMQIYPTFLIYFFSLPFINKSLKYSINL